MSYIKVHYDKISTPELEQQLMDCCPFGAITKNNGVLEIGAGCRMCKLCLKKGPAGAVEYVEEAAPAVDKDAWRGITVYVDNQDGQIHPVTYELLGKARELAARIDHPVYAVFIGHNISKEAEKLLHYGADKVFVIEDESLAQFRIDVYANAFAAFIEQVKPCAILVGATNIGRSLAPKVAARFRTGLTADCTKLEMKENTDLVQIRPAFGGNIMAQIVTTNNRPQFCTVRYKIFSAPARSEQPQGEIVHLSMKDEDKVSQIEILRTVEKLKEIDISEADVIVAAGRGVRTDADMEMIQRLADKLGAQLAGTRPMIEAGRLDPRRQIGLSGRTVKPKLIVCCGVSGSVQFAAGMRNSECIIAINNDRKANIFDIAHYGIVGDLYEVIPMLLDKLDQREERYV
ncbi:MAG: electron transfer flavoprotein subunit alpha [Firmicutes bacterium]|nr:electron transfer flavoprotein subunit alpha [Bacillota bacterium]